MAVKRAHNTVVLKGSMPGGEQWQCSVGLGADFNIAALTNLADLTTFLTNDVAGGTWAAALSGLLTYATPTITVDTVVANWFDNTGALTGTAQRSFTTVVGGTSATTAVLPHEVALVHSLRTDTPGAKARGRMYLPLNMATRDATTSELSATVQAAQLPLFKTFLEKIRLTANAVRVASDSRIIIASGADTGGGFGANYVVTRILLGKTFDSQRRRRRSIAEAYLSSAYP